MNGWVVDVRKMEQTRRQRRRARAIHLVPPPRQSESEPINEGELQPELPIGLAATAKTPAANHRRPVASQLYRAVGRPVRSFVYFFAARRHR